MTAVETTGNGSELPHLPKGPADMMVSIRQTFGINSDIDVPGFSETTEFVPLVDDAYTTLKNSVGPHGSTH